jgi:hypothetical protein
MGFVQESGPWHWMSHADAVQTIGPVHVSAALHPTLQALPPHAICCAHEPAPTQWTVHALAAMQSMVDAHEPAPVHVTVHGIPGGQTMGPVHVPAAVQSIVHVPPGSHVPTPASAQIEGHTSAASLTGRASLASLASAASPASFATFESMPVSAVASTGSTAASTAVVRSR